MLSGPAHVPSTLRRAVLPFVQPRRAARGGHGLALSSPFRSTFLRTANLARSSDSRDLEGIQRNQFCSTGSGQCDASGRLRRPQGSEQRGVPVLCSGPRLTRRCSGLTAFAAELHFVRRPRDERPHACSAREGPHLRRRHSGASIRAASCVQAEPTALVLQSRRALCRRYRRTHGSREGPPLVPPCGLAGRCEGQVRTRPHVPQRRGWPLSPEGRPQSHRTSGRLRAHRCSQGSPSRSQHRFLGFRSLKAVSCGGPSQAQQAAVQGRALPFKRLNHLRQAIISFVRPLGDPSPSAQRRAV